MVNFGSFLHKVENSCLFIYLLDISSASVTKYIRIYEDLTFDTNTSINSNLKIKSTSFLQNILDSLASSDITGESIKSKIISDLDSLRNEANESQVIFLSDQIRNILVDPNGRRYSSESFLIYLKMFLISPKLYRSLRKFDMLNIPHPSNIRKFFYNLDVSSDNPVENFNYLKHKLTSPASKDKFFVLMIDEIHIKPKAEFNLEYGFHGCDAKDLKLAKTVFAFMIKSIFGKYKEVIMLVPKYKHTSSDLYRMTNNALKLISDLGGTVVSIITDNNRVNVNLFNKLGCDKTSCCIPLPYRTVEADKLYLMFDPVHILKNVRNAFLNKRDPDQTILFYVRGDSSEKHLCKAKFKHLFDLYKESADTPLKISSTLTLRSLVSSCMEKQKS